jgi:CARDB
VGGSSRQYRTFVPPLTSDDAHAQSIDAELAAAGYWDPPRRRALLRGARVGALAGVAALAVIGATGVGAARLVAGGTAEPVTFTAPFVPPPPPVVGMTVEHHSTPAAPAPRRLRRTPRAIPTVPAPSRATRVRTSRPELRPARPSAKKPEAPTPPKPQAKAPPKPKLVLPVTPTVSTTTETIPPPDTTPPAVTIDSASTNMGEASFSFSSSEAASTFQCALDGAAFEPCTSPKAYGALAYGSHSFAVHATDAAGNTGADANHAWTYAQPLADLGVSSLTETSFTVANSGAAPAGPFVVSVTLIGTFSFAGLAPGESATRVWSACRVGTLNAIVDRGGTVAESDETNNARTLVSDC